ncbi:MAG: metallophosphoesterase [Anaerolineae bacterium]|nr:metallophosphoesterase [Anaerolineae bacterium]
MSRRKFLKLTAAGLAGMVGVPGVGISYAHYIEPHWVDISRVSLRLPRLHPAFQGFRLAQISDIHLDTWTGESHQRLKEAVDFLNQEKPDAVAITGDFVTATTDPVVTDPLVQELSRLKPFSVAVLGNHDYWTNAASIRQVLHKSGIVELDNDVVTLEKAGAALHLAGVDDIWEKKHRLDRVLEKLPDDGAAILLAHEPDFADESAATGRFDLQISGHSHGGQIRLPLFGAPVLPWLGQKYPSGQYQVGSMIQYTNRGLGMAFPTVRFNCRPEITLFTFLTPR